MSATWQAVAWLALGLVAVALVALPIAVYRARRGRKCGPAGGFEQSDRAR